MNRGVPINLGNTQPYYHATQQPLQNVIGKRPVVSTNDPTQSPKPPKPKQRPTDRSIPAKIQALIPDSKLYHDLRDIERRLDAVMTRKRFDIQDAINKGSKMKKTLRVFVSNTSSNQPWQTVNKKLDNHAFDFDTGAIPTWTLRIEGKLLENKETMKEKLKFSSFIKSIIVELDRNNRFFSDENIAKWHKSSSSIEFDGLEIKRRGDMNINVNILIYLNEYPEKYKLSPRLSQILDIKSETRTEIIMGLWEYIKFHKLQDEEEKRIINCDNNLKEIFAMDRIFFPKIPEIINKHLLPLDPIVIKYTICTDKDLNMSEFAYDIEVDIDDPIRQKMINILSSLSSQKKITELDDQIASVIQAINNSKVKYNFFEGFAQNPAIFIEKWLSSQSRDLEIILGDDDARERIGIEDKQRSEFYHKDWVHESVFHYLSRQESKRMQELHSKQK
ncbi:uncharacterized protein T551_01294 [Pneumocystis jirovecii RU7]|uniref:DM2 domain-containing protein n=3 Tax=Pneumocystis jirovecii TaxID=42068 RepID=A0A0W4ZS93_PNEJ7|nr:uncharacterized protein T551_01294 [Pneumocystis jirovecii RU7]KTW31221.1 hypothetical protein T551_01294 [Pneumocystis jirovecii RU7]